MNQSSVAHNTIDGFDVVSVDTGVLSLALMPELGGKISSLRDLRSGREWLWRHPRMAYKRVAHGDSYSAEADTGGWDECFPTVAPCGYPSTPWSGTMLPGHGELWSQPAALDVTEVAGMVQLRTRWQGIALPYTFERAITLMARSAILRCAYAVTNNADVPLQFIWSAHPLLAIEPGMRLLLPPARFNRWTTLPPDLLAQDSGLSYPPALRPGAPAIDLAALPDPSAGIALKLWSDPLDEGWATLQAHDGELRMRWDTTLLPQVALWMNLGAWAGDGGAPYFNLGLEPCIGAQDSLAMAARRGRCATLPPRGSRTWWIEVELAQ